MKIVLIGPVFPYRGGIAHFTTGLADQLTSDGHAVTVVSYSKQYPRFLYPGQSDKVASGKKYEGEVAYLLDPTSPKSWKKTAEFIKTKQPDLVVLQWWVTIWGLAYKRLAASLRSLGIPMVAVVHNALPHETKVWDKPLTRWGLAGIDRYLVMNLTQKQRLKGLGFAEQRIGFAPHPVFLMDEASQTEAGQSTQADKARKNLLFFGFVRDYKGLDLLLNAMPEVIKQAPEVRLRVAGEFWEDKQHYLKIIQENHLEGYVTIDDRYIPDDELPGIFSEADLLVAPYRGGTQSGVIKLAMGFGLPVLASSIVQDDFPYAEIGNVLTIDPTDPTQLVNGIMQGLRLQRSSSQAINDTHKRSWAVLLQALLASKPSQPQRNDG